MRGAASHPRMPGRLRCARQDIEIRQYFVSHPIPAMRHLSRESRNALEDFSRPDL